MNPRQPRTLTSIAIQNPKSDGHCMTVTTRGGKQIIDSPIPSGDEDEVIKDNELVEYNCELVDISVKEAEIPHKVIPLP